MGLFYFSCKGMGKATELVKSESQEIAQNGKETSETQKSWFDQLTLLCEEIASGLQLEVYDIEWGGSGGNRNLRVFLDIPSQPNPLQLQAEGEPTKTGVTLEDCVEVSRALNLRLDVEDIIPGGRYNLEVSSPGLERRLKTETHYRKSVGRLAKLKVSGTCDTYGATSAGLKKAKQVVGYLQECHEGLVRIDVKGEELKIPLIEVLKGNLVYDSSRNPF